MAIDAFKDTEWDGLMGLGFTMEGSAYGEFGMSILDRLLSMKSCR